MANRTEHLNRLVEEHTRERQRMTGPLRERDRQIRRDRRAAGRLVQRLLLPGTRLDWPELAWMVAIMARAAFTEVSRDSSRPGAVLSAWNARWQGLAGERYVSAFYGVYDRVLRRSTYANAGHPPPLHFDARERTSRPPGGPGFLLGIVPDAAYQEGSVELAPGDRLCLYTDGVTESCNPAGELFGIERLEATLCGAGRGGPDAVLKGLVEMLAAFRGERPSGDDLTLVVAEVRG